jgi:hypothetical protein
MALPQGISIGPGWSIGAGWKIGVGNYEGQTTTPSIQDVEAPPGSATGFFYVGGAGWSTLTGTPNLNNVAAGWTVDQIPGATVVSTDPGNQTITITGGTFTSGDFYTFTGV